MKRSFAFFLFAHALCSNFIWAQTATDLNEGSQLTHDSVNDTWKFSWWGRSGITYFMQQSDDLMSWQYIPVIEPGQNGVVEWNFATSADKLFMRLKHTDKATVNPFDDDFDGDGISNINELTAPSELNLDPFDPDSNDNGILDGFEDIDDDTLPDWWEIYWFGDLDQDANQDTDNDFISNGSEFLADTNPTMGQERFLVLERWPSNSAIDADGILNPNISLQLLGSFGFPLSGADLQLSIESGPFEFFDNSIASAQTIAQLTDLTGHIAANLRLNDFYTGTGSVRVTAGLDENAPSLVLPVSVAQGLPPAGPSAVTVVTTAVNAATISWQEAQDVIAGEIRYEIYRDGEVIGVTTDLQFSDSLPDGWQTAVYEVAAVDRTGARSTLSLSAILRNLPSTGIAGPSGIYLIEEKGLQATVAWDAGASESGIAAYHVELNGQVVATSPDTRWTFINLSPETAYSVVVYAVDQSGQVSTASDNFQFSTGIAPVRRMRGGEAHVHWFEVGQALYGWGDNSLDTLGAHYPEDSISRTNIQKIPVSSSLHPQVADIASGSFSSIVKSTEGSLAQVGVYKLEPGEQFQSFYRSPELENVVVESIGSGSYHFMVTTADTGNVYTWGVNDYQQLGYSTDGAYESTVPQQVVTDDVEPLVGAVQVTGGNDFSIARMNDGTLYSWGRKSRLGRPDNTGNSNDWDHPRPVLKANGQPLDTITDIACGASHSLALDSNGEVWSFGNNGAFQLGQIQNPDESEEDYVGDHLVPEKVYVSTTAPLPVLNNIIQVAAGDNHSLALDNQGDVWSWGYSEYGQLALPANFPVNFIPFAQKVEALDGIQIVSIAAGDDSSYACAADGTIWAWGRNHKGQLGDGTTSNRSTPVQALLGAEHITFAPYCSAPDGNRGVFVSTARLGATLRYTLDGSVVLEASPVVASGVALTPAPGTLIRVRPYIGNLAIGEEHRWRMPTVSGAAAGNGIVGHIDTNGQLSVWGKSVDHVPGSQADAGHFLGQLEETSVRAIDISGESIQVLTYKGELFGWGDNAEGQLLFGGPSRLSQPAREPQLTGNFIISGALANLNDTNFGGSHRIIQSGEGMITAGINTKGQLGLLEGSSDARRFGSLETPVTKHPVELVSAGTGVSFVHDTLGKTWALGDHLLSGYSIAANADYLANGDSPFYQVAVSNLAQISSGMLELAGLRSDGTVWTWGLDLEQSALVQPTQVYAEFSPANEGPLEDIVTIAYGHSHGLALRADGTVWSWGASLEGALGYDDPPDDKLARQVPGLTNIHWIAAGHESSFAGSADGTIWGWGRNTYGELGDSALSGGAAPVVITIPPASVPGTPSDDPTDPKEGENPYVPPSLTDPDNEPSIGPTISIEKPNDLYVAE